MSSSKAGVIGVGSAAALVAGNMIGAGVFTTSGFALADLGSRGAVLFAWLVGGAIALCGAVSYVRLAEVMPGSGGEYLFLSRTVHPLAGFLAGWISLLAGFTAPIAVAAHGLEAYVSASFRLAWSPGILGAVSIGLAGLVHALTVKSGLRFQNVAVLVQLIAIAGVIAMGAFALRLEAFEAVESGSISLSVFGVTLVWISFSYSGWNAAIYVAGEIGHTDLVLKRATLFGTSGVIVLYLALNAVFLYSAPVERLAGHAEIGAIAAESLGGPLAARALSAVVGLGLLTSISAMIMVGPRIYAKMADDGILPRVLGTAGTPPRAAIAMQVGLALFAFAFTELRDLLLYVGFLLGLSAAGTVGCLLVVSPLRCGQSVERRIQYVAAVAFLIATLGSAAFLVASEPAQAAAGIATLGVGVAVYAMLSRGRSRNASGRPARLGEVVHDLPFMGRDS